MGINAHVPGRIEPHTAAARHRISRRSAVSVLGCALAIATIALVSATSHARCGVLVQPLTAVAVQTRAAGAVLTEVTLHASALVHPGILIDRARLEVIKARLAAHAEPWTGALAALQTSAFASPSYQPRPRAEVECGAIASLDRGCSDEQSDAIAAYSHALLWFFTGDRAHADKAIEIMNAWSSVLIRHTGSTAPVRAAWAGSVFPRAAEIIRSTYDGWSRGDIDAFGRMLSRAYLPAIDRVGPSISHAELSMVEAAMAISVFQDDPAAFRAAVAQWRTRVPAYLYLTGDGVVPPPRRSGSEPAMLVDGQSQDTCRDLGHVQLGLAALSNAAETARIQGVDLFGEQAIRLQRSYELHAGLLDGAELPRSLCRGKLRSVTPDPTWEIGYNALANRAGLALPETQRLLTRIRPTGAIHHMAWETLTHAELGRRGP